MWSSLISYIPLHLAKILGWIPPFVGYTAAYLNIALAITRLLMVVKVNFFNPGNKDLNLSGVFNRSFLPEVNFHIEFDYAITAVTAGLLQNLTPLLTTSCLIMWLSWWHLIGQGSFLPKCITELCTNMQSKFLFFIKQKQNVKSFKNKLFHFKYCQK